MYETFSTVARSHGNQKSCDYIVVYLLPFVCLVTLCYNRLIDGLIDKFFRLYYYLFLVKGHT